MNSALKARADRRRFRHRIDAACAGWHVWFGDEFGPFLIHTDKNGVLLEAPIALPDMENAGKQIRLPQNPTTKKSPHCG